MTLHVPLEETRPPAHVIAWPSIAAASAQLRRPRHLRAVPARAGNPAVRGRAAPLRPTTLGSPRR